MSTGIDLLENCIQYRFSSETKFERIYFKSQSISYNEVMKKLNERKKIHLNTENDKLKRADKIDSIQLVNHDS